MKINKILISALRECKTKEDIEDVFCRFDITEITEKQRLLVWAMYAPALFFSSFSSISEDGIYQMTIEHFLSGTWKLVLLYEKLGLKKSEHDDYTKEMLKKLNDCSSKEDIDFVFETEKIDSYRKRCDVLRRCMGVMEEYGAIGELSEKDDYEFDCAVFLEGSWRSL